MTIVGKILVFVNLVFSLVVGGLVMVVYSTRANWEDYARKKDAQYQASAASNNQALQDLATARATYVKDRKDLTRERDEAIAARTKAEAEIQAKDKELATIKQKGLDNNADTTRAQAAAGARKDQIAQLTAQVDKERKEKQALIGVINKEREKRIESQVREQAHKARADQLEDLTRDLSRKLLRATSGTSTTTLVRRRGEENPPRDDIEGQIVYADPSSDLIKLSIGSDAGLEKGHTLKAFRLDRIPENSKYLGTIQILEVRPHEAVGRPLKTTAYPLRVGDHVASRIVAGNR
jgi:hypothetical protein